MDVSIIICTRNRAEHLGETLRSIAATDIPLGWAVELIVVDNGSTDNTAAVVAEEAPSHLPAQCIHEDEPGLSNARNAGIAASRGRVILFTDDDVRVPAQWIEGMAGPILRGEADAVSGGVVLAPHLQRSWMNGVNTVVVAETASLDPAAPKRLVGANMAFGCHVLDVVPSFDPELGPGPNSLGFADDTLFSYQVRAHDFHIVAGHDATVVHHCETSRLSRRAYLETMEKMGRSEGYLDYHWRHRPWAAWSRPRLFLSLVKAYARLYLGRLTHWTFYRQAEGMQTWEMEAVEQVYRVRQLLHERRRLRNYAQYGKRKLHGAQTRCLQPAYTSTAGEEANEQTS